MADPCPFSACQLLSHRHLPCGFPQVSVADSGRPADAKDSMQASISKGLLSHSGLLSQSSQSFSMFLTHKGIQT